MQLTLDQRGAVRLLSELRSLDKRARSATAQAMNAAVFHARKVAQDEMRRVFDQPTPWVLASIRYTKAAERGGQLTATVDFGSKTQGVTPSKVLWTEVYAGRRAMKRHEVALQRIGVLPKGMAAVPGQAAQRDRFGNMAAGQINQILSWFAAFSQQGKRANMTDESRKKRAQGGKRARGSEYFALPSRRGRLLPGIYRRTRFAFGSAIQPVMIFIRQPSYTRRFDFYGITRRAAEQEFNRVFPEKLNASVQR